MFGEWKHVRSITLTLSKIDWAERGNVILSAGGHHFALRTYDGTIIWNLTTGSIVTRLRLPNRTCRLRMSSDGFVLVYYNNQLAVNFLQSGTTLATSNTLPGGSLPVLMSLGSTATRREHRPDIAFGRGSIAAIHSDLLKDFKVIDRILWCPLFFLDPRDSGMKQKAVAFFVLVDLGLIMDEPRTSRLKAQLPWLNYQLATVQQTICPCLHY